MKPKIIILCFLFIVLAGTPQRTAALDAVAIEGILKRIATIVGQINELIIQIGGAMEANAEYIETYSEMNADKMELQATLSMKTAKDLLKLKEMLENNMFAGTPMLIANERIMPGGLGASACMMNKDAKREIQNRMGEKYFNMHKQNVLNQFSGMVPVTDIGRATTIEDNIIKAALQADINLNPDDNDVMPVNESSVLAAASRIMITTQPRVPTGLPETDSIKVKMAYLASKEGYNNTLYSFISAMMTDMAMSQFQKFSDNGSGESAAMQRIRDFAYATSKKRALSDQAKTPAGLAMEEYNLLARQMSYLLDEHQSLMNQRKVAIAESLRNLEKLADKLR